MNGWKHVLAAVCVCLGSGWTVAAAGEKPMIKAEIVMAKSVYVLPDGIVEQLGKTKAGAGRLPDPPAVDGELRLINAGAAPVCLTLGGDAALLTLDLRGPGAVSRETGYCFTMEFRRGERICLQPGETTAMALKSLGHGRRRSSMYSYWTKPGRYTLRATYTCEVTAQGATASRRLTLRTAPTVLEVARRSITDAP